MGKSHRVNLYVGSLDPQQTDIAICQGDKGIDFDIGVSGIDTTDTIAKIVFRKRNGEVVEGELPKVGDRYKYTTLGNETSFPGTVVADVKIYEDENRYSTAKFIFTVDQDTMNDTPISSSAYSASLDEAINDALDAAAEARIAALNASTGIDGFSPIANVSKVGSITTISITDKLGTTTEEIYEGISLETMQDYVDELAETKADRSRNYTATLLYNAWTGSSAPYTQTVTITGITSADEPFVDIVLSSDKVTAINENSDYANVSKITTGTNTITATCNENVPTVNLNIKLKVVD